MSQILDCIYLSNLFHLNAKSVEHNIQSSSRIIRIFSELGDRIFQLGESPRRDRSGDMARLPDPTSGRARQRVEDRAVARNSAGTIYAIQDIFGHSA